MSNPPRDEFPERRWAWCVTRPVLYPDAYIWLVFVSALDIMLTWLILSLGGREVNPIAHAVLAAGGLVGIIFFKFAVVVLVISICELIGRWERRKGLWLARAAVVISTIPVVLSLGQLIAAYL